MHKRCRLKRSKKARHNFSRQGAKEMNLAFENKLATKYYSETQRARVLTENWVNQNMYCPRCGSLHINHFENNRPVADFYCPLCRSEYELKSKDGNLGQKINDGAYNTMIQRITSNDNPDFFFMSYSKKELMVRDLIFVPKHFFVPSIIEKRKPLSPTARRANWVGCNILLSKIPQQGRIEIISNGKVIAVNDVVLKVAVSSKLKIKDINSRGWIMDILNCINKIDSITFSLEDIYSFEHELQNKYPQNHNVRPKIRQQLQLLRDKGFIDFLGNGTYRKVI